MGASVVARAGSATGSFVVLADAGAEIPAEITSRMPVRDFPRPKHVFCPNTCSGTVVLPSRPQPNSRSPEATIAGARPTQVGGGCAGPRDGGRGGRDRRRQGAVRPCLCLPFPLPARLPSPILALWFCIVCGA